MDKLLHRGAHAVAGDHQAAREPHPLTWLGINHEFTRGDRAVNFAKIGWTTF